MNNLRRKRIKNIIKQLESSKKNIEAILQEEENYIYMIPDNLQFSKNYDKSQEAIDNIEYSSITLDEVISNLFCALD